MGKRHLQAIEQLRAQVEQAATAARANPLWDAELPGLAALAAAHPLGTVRSGWTNPYPKDDPRSLLLEYQFADFHDRSRFKVGLQARQTGKDFTGQGEIVEDCHLRAGTDWMVAAPSERQALDSLSQGKLWAEGFKLSIADYREEREGSSETLLKSAEIVFPNKARIRAVPGKPDTVRGRSSNIYLTEFDFFEDPVATWRAILPSITNPLRGGEKKVRLKSTPNGKDGAMHRIWVKPDTPRMKWSRRLVTIYHAVLMGLPVDIEQLREALNDPEGFQQECECVFLDGSNVLLPYELIALAESAEASEACDPALFAARGSRLVCGIDFGRQNDPTVCVTLEEVGDILWTREVLVLDRVSTPDQLEALKHRVAAARRTCFDYTGPGVGLGDFLVKEPGVGEWAPEKHQLGRVELCTFTANLKREIFPKLRRKFEAPTKIRVPISRTVREDLHAMQQVVTNGQYNYWAPRTREGHSDRCTAYALAVRAAGEGGPVQHERVERAGRAHAPIPHERAPLC